MKDLLTQFFVASSVYLRNFDWYKELTWPTTKLWRCLFGWSSIVSSCSIFSSEASWKHVIHSRTNFVASSKHFEKINSLPFLQLTSFFIGLNESSHQELSNQSFFFEKFQIFRDEIRNFSKKGQYFRILVFPIITFEMFGIFQKKLHSWKARGESFHLSQQKSTKTDV